MGLEGKNVLVTGASSGIGQAIAIRFGQERGNVAVNEAHHRLHGQRCSVHMQMSVHGDSA